VYLAGLVAGIPRGLEGRPTDLKKIDETLARSAAHSPKLLSATVYLASMATYNDMNAAWDPGGQGQHAGARDGRGAAGIAQVSGRDHVRRGNLVAARNDMREAVIVRQLPHAAPNRSAPRQLTRPDDFAPTAFKGVLGKVPQSIERGRT